MLDTLAQPENPKAAFAPPAGEPIGFGKIPAHQGFHSKDGDNIVWLDHKVRPRIHFRPPCARGCISLRLYGPREFYPAERMTLHLDGTPMPTHLATTEGKSAPRSVTPCRWTAP